jgi:hypothetical protein
MKKLVIVLLAVLAVSLFVACGTLTVTRPVDASNNPIGSKVGEVSESVKVVFGFPLSKSWDVPAVKAAQNGGITKIATVDFRHSVKRSFISRTITYTTIVTGE